jgi:hypothetical protein
MIVYTYILCNGENVGIFNLRNKTKKYTQVKYV